MINLEIPGMWEIASPPNLKSHKLHFKYIPIGDDPHIS